MDLRLCVSFGKIFQQYLLAVIQFNSSGSSKKTRIFEQGWRYVRKSPFLATSTNSTSSVNVYRMGTRVRQNVAEGQRFLVQANAREIGVVLSMIPTTLTFSSWLTWNQLPPHHEMNKPGVGVGCPLLSDFSCNVSAPEAHPANHFLADWFAAGVTPLLRSSGYVRTPDVVDGDKKARVSPVSVYDAVNYCSRACQALDWNMRHSAHSWRLD
ncbi:hypothetical protein U1Q18_012483 [Sarracenia purpurea var. burkii]